MQSVRSVGALILQSNKFDRRTFCAARRSVLVTGGANGIGQAISKRLSQDGYNVAICDIAAEGEQFSKDIGGMFIRTDVTEPKQVEQAVAQVVKAYGRLDAMVNNAGVVGAQVPLGEYDLEEWKRVTDVNLNGAFFALKFSLAQMVKQPTGGSIVNMSSIAGFRGICNLSPYTAAKWALRGLSQQAAVEYCEKNIRVNAVAPTGCETPMVANFIKTHSDPAFAQEMVTGQNALPGVVQPSDVANVVAFLLSDDARYITGHTIPVDAGALSRKANQREMDNVK